MREIWSSSVRIYKDFKIGTIQEVAPMPSKWVGGNQLIYLEWEMGENKGKHWENAENERILFK